MGAPLAVGAIAFFNKLCAMQGHFSWTRALFRRLRQWLDRSAEDHQKPGRLGMWFASVATGLRAIKQRSQAVESYGKHGRGPQLHLPQYKTG